MTGRRQPESYDEVRRALLERGYLATPLERMFLGRAADPFGASLRGRLLSALLAGLVAGPLLGVILAAVLVIEERGVTPVWPDGVLYAVLFAPVLGAVVALAEALAGVIVRLRARTSQELSPRRAALAAGLSVAGVFALYLGIWWVRAGGRFALVDVVALLVLALGAGFAGRVVSAAALIQATVSAGRAPRRARPRFGGMIGGAALGIAIVAALAVGWLAGRAAPAAPVAVRSAAPERALFVAWDGMSLDLLMGVVHEQRVWPFEAFDAVVAPLVGAPGMDPAATWITVATGCPPALHGVGGLELTGLVGARAPAPGAGISAGPLELLKRLWPTRRRVAQAGVRRVPAFWEVTADARTTAVVGWWATWPATPPGATGGYLVSDGALAALRRGRSVEEAIHPPGWGAAHGPAWLADAESAAEAALGEEASDQSAREALVSDLFAVRALRAALEDPGVAVATVYLPGLDIVRERCRALGCDPFETARRVRHHAETVSEELRTLLEGGASSTLTFMVGLPGRTEQVARGVLLALYPQGGRGEGGLTAPEAPLVAVAPSFLAAAGFTVDDRMTGPVAPWAVRAGIPIDRRRTRVAPARAAAVSDELERDVVERLKSLGYVR